MKNKEPLVSIIIPTYNRAKYITRSIESCLNQTYKNIEVLIIDDYSTDNTEKTIKNINDKRLKYFKNEKNSGPCISRNNGIKLSSGEYINFLDDDDELLLEKIEFQLEKFRTSSVKNLGVVTTDIKYIRPDRNLELFNRSQGFIFDNFLKKTCVFGTASALIKNEKNIFFDESLESGQETDFLLQLSILYNFDYIEGVYVNIYESENQISYNFRKKINGIKYFHNKYKKYYKKFSIKTFLRIKVSYYLDLLKYYIGLIFGKNIYIKFSNFLSKIINLLK